MTRYKLEVSLSANDTISPVEFGEVLRKAATCIEAGQLKGVALEAIGGHGIFGHYTVSED